MSYFGDKTTGLNLQDGGRLEVVYMTHIAIVIEDLILE